MQVKNPNLLFRNIRMARVQAGLSQKDFARKLGVSDKTISAYETGRAIPPTKALSKIASIAGLSLSELMGVKEKDGEGALSKKLDLLAEKISDIAQQTRKSMDTFVGVVLIDKDKRAYLIKENDKNQIGKDRWNLPGGSVDAGEGLLEAASRETKEETGYGAKITSLIGCYKCKKGDKSWVYIVFGAEVLDHKQKPVDPGVKEGKWFTKADFLKMNSELLVHSDMKLVYGIATSGRGLAVDSIKYIDYDLQ
uniref:NUDIX domain-containing protein n=1 Tax=candidate division WWE3 bacterium TaxID=2053526 RepID=A0A7C4XVD9_UNCKA